MKTYKLHMIDTNGMEFAEVMMQFRHAKEDIVYPFCRAHKIKVIHNDSPNYLLTDEQAVMLKLILPDNITIDELK